MNKELTNILYERYPLIFAEKDLPETKSCMYWGFECSDGWFNLINEMCSLIQSHCNQNKFHHKLNWLGNKLIKTKMFRNKMKWRISAETRLTSIFYMSTYKKEIEGCNQVVAEQVKEKFGSLRFYYRGGDEFISGVTCFAEALSETTCEFCGSPATIINMKSWYNCICEKCKEKRSKNEEHG